MSDWGKHAMRLIFDWVVCSCVDRLFNVESGKGHFWCSALNTKLTFFIIDVNALSHLSSFTGLRICAALRIFSAWIQVLNGNVLVLLQLNALFSHLLCLESHLRLFVSLLLHLWLLGIQTSFHLLVDLLTSQLWIINKRVNKAEVNLATQFTLELSYGRGLLRILFPQTLQSLC